MLQSIEVSLGARSYKIHIGHAKSGDLAKTIDQLTPAPSKMVVVYDHRIEAIALRMASELGVERSSGCLVEVPSGEESKSILHLEHLWKRLLHCGADRKTILIAVGGGVIGDLAGFAAATWNRGIRFVQVPTTLLAMVDSSVGGKTGINLPEAKNVIGSFWQPTMVWSDVSSLQSLPTREFRSGLAEVVKYGVILDSEFFEYLEYQADAIMSRDADALTEIIRRSCILKARIVAEDEWETTGRRAILNYGHTFGHAIESLTEYGTLLHGEAVSIGMSMAGHLAASLQRWPEQSLDRQDRLLERFGLPTQIAVDLRRSFTVDRMIQAMMHDKKNTYGKLNLVLPSRLGAVEIVSDAPIDRVRELISVHLGYYQ
jgi:3-dehydroquinate synthase